MDDKAGAAVHAPLIAENATAGHARCGPAVAEAQRPARLAVPMVASCALQFVVNMVSLVFVGHLGELPLAGASLATSLANVTGYSVLTGMATALDTLSGQAFGARQHRLLGVYKQRAMVVLALACVPISVAWAFAGWILRFLGQDPDIAAEAGSYARWLIPSLVAVVPLQCHMRFLQTQSVVLPVTASSAVAALCHPLVCWALVHKAGMGSRGAALSNAVAWTVNLAILVALEWWSFEFMLLLSGLLPNPKLETSVLSISLNTEVLLYMIPYGLSSAVSTRVSNELGAGRPQAAKLASRIVMCMTLSEGMVVTLTMTLLRSVWGYMYSDEQEVVAYIARVMPVLGIAFVVDGLHCSLSGVLTRCGMQMIGAVVNLGAFYLAGIPMAVLLGFVLHLNGVGLWLGIICGSLTKLTTLGFVLWFIDWEKEAHKAKERVFSSSSLPAS